ncbi:hypothetical protein Q8F55_000071 [Vanrija albida]|uniref:F-box domain-containing protein n=1 Tax=Vanrija albida TaxID=181172 RepID=A0ABR3QCU4_9TREE
MSTVIDHTANPHIIDAILASCDTPTTLAFRLASRAYRAAVDATLAHVALYLLPTAAPDGTPRFRFVRPVDYRGWTSEPHPPPPFLSHLPATVRALDVDTAFLRGEEIGACTSVRVVRRCGRAVWCRPGAFHSFVPELDSLVTMVDFMTVDDYGGELLIPHGLQEYVLHVRWDDSDQGVIGVSRGDVSMRSWTRAWPREMVLVLQPCSRAPPATADCLMFLRDVAVTMLGVLDAGGEVCVVGVEKVSPLNMGWRSGESKSEDRRDLFKAMLSGFWREWGQGVLEVNTDERRADLLAQVDFTTVNEWHSQLKEKGRDQDGLDMYDLQAVWPPYANA